MGLVQRQIEEAGITTVSLSPIFSLTASVGVPRIGAIEYPMGRPMGAPGDSEGQSEVLRRTLAVAATARTPGTVVHLPFRWPGPRSKAIAEAEGDAPIVKLLRRKPWLLPRLFSRDVPS